MVRKLWLILLLISVACLIACGPEQQSSIRADVQIVWLDMPESDGESQIILEVPNVPFYQSGRLTSFLSEEGNFQVKVWVRSSYHACLFVDQDLISCTNTGSTGGTSGEPGFITANFAGSQQITVCDPKVKPRQGSDLTNQISPPQSFMRTLDISCPQEVLDEEFLNPAG